MFAADDFHLGIQLRLKSLYIMYQFAKSLCRTEAFTMFQLLPAFERRLLHTSGISLKDGLFEQNLDSSSSGKEIQKPDFHKVLYCHGGGTLKKQPWYDKLKLPEIHWQKAELSKFEKAFPQLIERCGSRSPEEVNEYTLKHRMSVAGSAEPQLAIEFSDIDFPSSLKNYLTKKEFAAPTPVQAIGWTSVLSGRDFVGIGETGSGKTLGFMLPAIVHAQHREQLVRNCPLAMVLCPTRELAQQTQAVFNEVCKDIQISSVAIFGGARKTAQSMDITNHQPQVWIATPGRLYEMMVSAEAHVSDCSYVVLDEADRMLDMGFGPQIQQILAQIRPDRQTQLWSATWPEEVQVLASNYITNPITVKIGSEELFANASIEQKFLFCQDNKIKLLVDQLKSCGRALVFANSKKKIERIDQSLKMDSLKSITLHGDHSQKKRDFALRAFMSGRVDFLIATDVAARGLDFDVDVVINYDMPPFPEGYVHRIGRTGRAGKKGLSISFMTSMDKYIGTKIKELLEREKQRVPEDLIAALLETPRKLPYKKNPLRRRR